MAELSILTSVKKNVGVMEADTAFDVDIITDINAALSTLSQLIQGSEVISIEDDSITWDDLDLSSNQLNTAKSYIVLKVRMLFDPPNTSFHLSAMKEQIQEYEARLIMMRDEELASEEV